MLLRQRDYGVQMSWLTRSLPFTLRCAETHAPAPAALAAGAANRPASANTDRPTTARRLITSSLPLVVIPPTAAARAVFPHLEPAAIRSQRIRVSGLAPSLLRCS